MCPLVGSSFAALETEWDALAVRTGNVFSTLEWATTWWRHFGRDRPLLLTACRDSAGRIVAILPLYLYSERPLRVVRFVGHGAGDQLGPICLRSEDRATAAACLRRMLDEACADLFVGDRLLREEHWSALLAARVLREEPTPVLRLESASWDDLLNGLGKNLRANIRQYERRLTRDHGAQYRLAGRDRSLESALDALFDLHRARWGDASAYLPHEAFHRDFAAAALARGWLRLWTLDADGVTVGALCAFRLGNVEAYYQSGRDPTWRGPSIGSALLAHSIRDAIASGVKEYRFLRGDEGFKSKFANDDPGLETVAVGCSGCGRAVVAVGDRLPRGLLRRVRSRLER